MKQSNFLKNEFDERDKSKQIFEDKKKVIQCHDHGITRKAGAVFGASDKPNGNLVNL